MDQFLIQYSVIIILYLLNRYSESGTSGTALLIRNKVERQLKKRTKLLEFIRSVEQTML